MEFLALAIKAGVPLIHVRTDDIINVEKILTHIAGEKVIPLSVPVVIEDVAKLKFPEGRVFYTSVDCKSLVKLYKVAVAEQKVIIFVNNEKSVIFFDGNNLIAPKPLVMEILNPLTEEAEALHPSFAGLTLKDITEMAQITMTRDESLTVRGVTETRRQYNNLKGIQQVDTNISFYQCPPELSTWMKHNKKFFHADVIPALRPKGLLFDGPAGTGKTLASKYIANELGVPLYRLDLGATMGKYVGQSEEQLTAALAQLDSVKPSVCILDEIEKVFQSQGDSGVTSRLLSQLLWWLNEQTGTFVVMTTNDLSRIPEELYREGRIDKTMEFLGIQQEEDGLAFATGVFDALLIEMGEDADPEFNKALAKKVTMLFANNEPVPQAKITQTVRDLVRELAYEEEA